MSDKVEHSYLVGPFVSYEAKEFWSFVAPSDVPDAGISSEKSSEHESETSGASTTACLNLIKLFSIFQKKLECLLYPQTSN